MKCDPISFALVRLFTGETIVNESCRDFFATAVEGSVPASWSKLAKLQKLYAQRSIGQLYSGMFLFIVSGFESILPSDSSK